MCPNGPAPTVDSSSREGRDRSGGDPVRTRGNERPTVAAVDNGPALLQAAARHRPGLPILVLSQHVEQMCARELLADGTGGIGYLLKDSVFDNEQFIDAIRRVAAGGTAMDPAVVSQLMVSHARDRPLATLTAREREVLELMAEGCSNTAIAHRLAITEGAAAKHISSIFVRLTLPPDSDSNRRVLAVLAYLNA
ncbi:LuxR C-terminal-related transcriptional regulator [Kitasatospora sp. NPDC094011]|uniref:LuxR C-terminal-related transcriptional regulator n=1 Tax=Kitasatospora sp. NPDC094011 TaxID=3364090 RepID=UPI0038083D6D